MKSYDQLRKEAWDFYSKLEPVCCPLLNNEFIYFTKQGFNHLVQKGAISRSQNDQMRRFKLLKHVLIILKDNGAKLSSRKGSTAIFWMIKKSIGSQIIRVVIRQFHGEKKHFFSIMND
jgi:hypothetical protein